MTGVFLRRKEGVFGEDEDLEGRGGVLPGERDLGRAGKILLEEVTEGELHGGRIRC